MTDYYFPSIVSFCLIAAVITCAFVISRPIPLGQILHSRLTTWWGYLTLPLIDGGQLHTGRQSANEVARSIVDVFTGVTVVVIALVVFVAESIRDDSDTERKRVLLKISKLWPLGIAAVMFPFGLLWSAAHRLIILMELAVALVTLYAFARVIQVLLDPDTRNRDQESLLRRRVREAIRESADQRIGNSILLQNLGPGRRIAFQYTASKEWVDTGSENYRLIDASQDGVISDIQLVELEKLANHLDRFALETLQFSIRDQPETARATQDIQNVTNSPVRPKTKKAYLLKRYKEEVPQDSIFYGQRRSLLALPVEFAEHAEVMEYVRGSLDFIFRFNKAEPASVAIRREMQGTKDRLIQAIRNNAVGAVAELRQIYLGIAEDFLESLVELGGGYTAEQAAAERSSLFDGWAEIQWLRSDLRELIIIAADAGNIEALGQIAFLPFGFAIRAIRARDHLIFQQFLQFATFLYFLTTEDGTRERVKHWLIDRSWRWPREIVDFYISHGLSKKDASVEDLEQLKQFALYILRIFQDLLKDILDNGDTLSFQSFAPQFGSLFRTFLEDRNTHSPATLRMHLDAAKTAVERERLQEALARTEKREETATVLRRSIDVITLALSGRALAQYLAKHDEAHLARWNTIKVLLPSTLTHLTTVYVEAIDFSESDRWGWDQWDMLADGQAHFIDRHSRLNQVYVVGALEILRHLPQLQRESIVLPKSWNLSEATREGNSQGLTGTLNAIESDNGKWQGILSEQAKELISLLRTKFKEARQAYLDDDAARVRAAPLDQHKLTEFREDLVQEYLQIARLRRLFEHYNAVVLQLAGEPDTPAPFLGIKQVDDRNAFVAQKHTTYAHWGRTYGNGLAQGEDESAFASMVTGASPKGVAATGLLLSEISDVLRNESFRQPIILQTLNVGVEDREFRKESAFKGRYELSGKSPWEGFKGFMGMLSVSGRSIPIFDVFVQRDDLRNTVLIVEPDRYLRWRQLRPDPASLINEDAARHVLSYVTDLNRDDAKRQELLAQNIPWLQQEQNPEEYLRDRVLVTVQERFLIDIQDATLGVCITLSEE